MQKAKISENDSTTSEKMTFTLAGALLGAKRTIPLAISAFAIGIVFGVLARQAKLRVHPQITSKGRGNMVWLRNDDTTTVRDLAERIE